MGGGSNFLERETRIIDGCQGLVGRGGGGNGEKQVKHSNTPLKEE